MSKPTPRPWNRAAIHAQNEIVDNAETGTWKLICKTERREDTTLILKCVNLHDELVGFIKGLAVRLAREQSNSLSELDKTVLVNLLTKIRSYDE